MKVEVCDRCWQRKHKLTNNDLHWFVKSDICLCDDCILEMYEHFNRPPDEGVGDDDKIYISETYRLTPDGDIITSVAN